MDQGDDISRTTRDVLLEARNTEVLHATALATALAEHEHVRRVALLAFRNEELRTEELKLRHVERQEQERLKLEEERAASRARIAAIAAQRQARPRTPTPPPYLSPPRRAATPVQPPVAVSRPVVTAPPPQPERQYVPPQIAPQPPPQAPPLQTNNLQPPRQPEQAPAPAQLSATPQPSQTQQPSQSQHPSRRGQPSRQSPYATALPGTAEYYAIHQRLKELRRYAKSLGVDNAEFRKKMGEMRRKIKVSMGQLTGERGANKVPVSNTIMKTSWRTG